MHTKNQLHNTSSLKWNCQTQYSCTCFYYKGTKLKKATCNTSGIRIDTTQHGLQSHRDKSQTDTPAPSPFRLPTKVRWCPCRPGHGPESVTREVHMGALQPLKIRFHPIGIYRISKSNMLNRSELCEDNITQPIPPPKKKQWCNW